MQAYVSRRAFLTGGLLAGAGLLLAACGQAMAPAESIAEDQAPEPQEEPKAAEPVVVKYLHNQNSQEVWQASWGGLFAAFEEANSGIKLEIL